MDEKDELGYSIKPSQADHSDGTYRSPQNSEYENTEHAAVGQPTVTAGDDLGFEDDDHDTIRPFSRFQQRDECSEDLSPTSCPAVDVLPDHSPYTDPSLLSPMSNLPFIPFLEPEHLDGNDTIDSGYADSWTSPSPLRMSPPSSPFTSSTPSEVSPRYSMPPFNTTSETTASPNFVVDQHLSLDPQPCSHLEAEISNYLETALLNSENVELPIKCSSPDRLLTSLLTDQEHDEFSPDFLSAKESLEVGSIEHMSESSPTKSIDHAPTDDDSDSSSFSEEWVTEISPKSESFSQSPPLRPADFSDLGNENDVLQSLYDVYSEIPSLDTGSAGQSLAPDLPPAALCSNLDPAPDTGLLLSVHSDDPGGLSPPLDFSFPHGRVFTPPRFCDEMASVQSPSSFNFRQSIPTRNPIHGNSAGTDPETLPGISIGSRNSVASHYSIERHKREPKSIITSLSSPSHATKDLLCQPLQPLLDIEKPLGGSHCISLNKLPILPQTTHLKPLRLSIALGLNSPIFTSTSPSSSKSLSKKHIGFINRTSIASTSVSSDFSVSDNPLSSCSRSPLIPRHARNSFISINEPASLPLNTDPDKLPTAPLSHPESWPPSLRFRTRLDHLKFADARLRSSSSQSEPVMSHDDIEGNSNNFHRYDRAICQTAPIPPRVPLSAGPTAAPVHPTFHAIATPRPTLMFAIASDDVVQVKRVLEDGEVQPNDQVGPLSALAFTVTNDKLTHKIDIVKTLLAYGADPATLRNPENKSPQFPPNGDGVDSSSTTQFNTLLENLDPATKYYVCRADAAHTRRTSALIHRSFFRPLTRIRYALVGQDCALEELFRVLSIHSQQLSVAPIVALLCGPSGHGKSLLAHKFGSLLDVPTHTVNMTTLRSTHEIWQSCSMSPNQEPSSLTLAEFLVDNEGRRCVVVLDEIEKIEDEKILWSLLMPWEHGRCSLGAGKRYIDVRNVIWLGTSNVGHELIFEYHAHSEAISRDKYAQLMGLLRHRMSECLGVSLISRVTTVLPFTPFSLDEKKAISMEALHSLAGESVRGMPSDAVGSIIRQALSDYVPVEGARSLYRAVSNQLACEAQLN